MGTTIGGINVVLSANAASFSAGIAQAQAQLNKLAGVSRQTAHGMVTDVQASSAAIRALEGGMQGNIRAAEKFISTIPGIGKALQFAFPFVGAVAVGGIFVRIGDEVVKFIEKVREAPRVIQEAFTSLSVGTESTIDSLKLSTAEIEIKIDKLLGRRPNYLALELAEASVAADKLASSLEHDNQKIAQLLTQNHVSAFGFLGGQTGTAYVEGSVNAFDQQIAHLGAEYQHAIRAGNTAAAAGFLKDLHDKQDAAQKYAQTEIAQRKQAQQQPLALSQEANINILQGFSDTIGDQRDLGQAEDANRKATVDLKQLEGRKGSINELLQLWRQQLAELKADYDITLAQEGQFWVTRLETQRKGSRAYAAALEEVNKVIGRERAKNMREQDEFDKTSSRITPADLSRDDRDLGGAGRDATGYLKNLNEGIDLQRKNAAALTEASLQMALATGQISKLDAAQVQAKHHADEYAAAQQRIADAMSAVLSNTGLSDIEQKGLLSGLRNQSSQLSGQYAVQQLGDRQAISSQQIGPGIREAIDQMVSSWKDMTDQIKSNLVRTVDGLNDNIVKALTGQKTDFGKVLQQSGRGLIKTGLQRAEGALLGGLGFGKHDGSSEAAALWVRMAGAGSGTPGSGGGLGGLLGKIPGLQFIQPFFQGHFAGGGDFLGGHPMMVGERGPEIITPRRAGTVIPSHALGGVNHYYTINAQGATDPAAIHAAVARALPHAVTASAQVQHQMSTRKPQGR